MKGCTAICRRHHAVLMATCGFDRAKRIRCEDGDTALRESQKLAPDPGLRRSRSQSSRLARLPGYTTKLGSITYLKPFIRAISAELVVG